MTARNLFLATWLATQTLAVALCSAPSYAATYTVNSEADVPEDTPGDGTCDPVFAIPGVCTLRAAVMEANAHAGSDTILLTANQTYTLTRAGPIDNASASDGDLDIHDSVSIFFFASGVRPVVDVSGLEHERAFEIHEGNVVMFAFDITGGDATAQVGDRGGAIRVGVGAGSVQLSLLRMYANRAYYGSALFNDGSDTTLTASELYTNETVPILGDYEYGSAIRNNGVLAIAQSSIFENAQTAIMDSSGESLNVINSTIASNTGNGIRILGESDLEVSNSTIAANAENGIRVGVDVGALELCNTVLAYHSIGDCRISSAAVEPSVNCWNMDSDNTCGLAPFNSNEPGVDPLLTPLARHGGFTHVAWPLTNSPVIEDGSTDFYCATVDQHNLSRPIDFDANGNARCDIGAIEMSHDVIFFDPFERL